MMNTEIRTMVRPKRKVVERNFRINVLNSSLQGKTLYCGNVLGSAINIDKFKQMVKCKLRCVGSSAEISVEIYWDNDRIECDLDFFEMWLNAVEDADGFVTLRVSVSGDCAGMTGGVSVDCAGMSGGCTDMASRGSIVLMENLDNNDVLENILFRLPFGVASQAKRVCKLWKTLLDNRRHNEVGFLFACHDNEDNKIQLYFGEEYDQIDGNKMNYYYSHETFMEMEHCRFAHKSCQSNILVGSCNGFVCFRKWDHDDHVHEPFAICNPLTGEFIFLKANFSRVWDEVALVSSGFGYCPSTGEYKVVRLHTLDSEELYGSYVQVYTIGSNEWRDMETFLHRTFCASGIFANGVLHWLDYDRDRSAIVAFDLEDEKFRELPLPPPEVLEHGDNPWNELKLLGGNLCWVRRIRTKIDIWAYRKNNLNTNNTRYDMEEHDQKLDYYSETSWSWVKEFNIECGNYCEPFAITKSNQVLFMFISDLYCYDPKTQTMSKLGDDNGMGYSRVSLIPHANSNISLKDFGETWYGPGCSTNPQTNSYVSLAEVRDAFSRREENMES